MQPRFTVTVFETFRYARTKNLNFSVLFLREPVRDALLHPPKKDKRWEAQETTDSVLEDEAV